MPRLRLLFILSLITLAGVFIAVLFLIPPGEGYPESSKAQIIHDGDVWIIQYDIINQRETDTEYTIHVNIDDVFYSDSTIVTPGRIYTYIHHINPQEISEGRVTVTLYEAGRAEPVEQNTYYIDLD
ncbi:hypothetical protein ACFLYF_01900 [Chloroflexota bacterium]